MRKTFFALFTILILNNCNSSNEKSQKQEGMTSSSSESKVSSSLPDSNNNIADENSVKNANQKVKNFLRDDCVACLTTNSNEYNALKAAQIIFNFQSLADSQDDFKIKNYGGTIYLPYGRNYTYFKTYENQYDDTLLFKFHICYDKKPTVGNSNLYLAFETELCNSGKFENKINADSFLVSTDSKFTKVKWGTYRNFEADIQNNICNPSYTLDRIEKYQKKYKSEVSNDEVNFNTKGGKLKAAFACDNEGAFVFNRAVVDILSDVKCKGIRYYFGYEDIDPATGQTLANKLRIVLVGVDKDGKNLNIWRETSAPYFFAK